MVEFVVNSIVRPLLVYVFCHFRYIIYIYNFYVLIIFHSQRNVTFPDNQFLSIFSKYNLEWSCQFLILFRPIFSICEMFGRILLYCECSPLFKEYLDLSSFIFWISTLYDCDQITLFRPACLNSHSISVSIPYTIPTRQLEVSTMLSFLCITSHSIIIVT